MKTLPLLMSVVLLAALLHEGGVQGWRRRRRRRSVPTAQCTVPADNPANGVWRKEGNQLHLVCNSRYQLVGTHRTCHNGQWTGSSPFCRPSTWCSSASRPTLADGRASCTSQKCSFSCNRGYTLFPHTSHSATCSAPNTWSPSPPTCRRCLPPTLADGTVSCPNDDSCSFTCDFGFFMFPPSASSASCMGNNRWSPSLPTCLRNCGNPATAPNVDYSSRIAGGHEARQHSWPWMVSLREVYDWGGNHVTVQHVCGGSLVDRQWVVTTAECAGYMAVNSASQAVLGGIQHGIAESIKHPQYVVANGNNNIGLIKLAAPVTYGRKVHPVCLPAAGRMSLARGTQCVATGWGATDRFEHANEDVANTLKQVVLPVSTRADCYPFSGELPANSFCAGLFRGGRELCRGDEGGPLVHEQNGVWTLVGVASESKGNCWSERARGTIFTDVAAFRSWLETTIRARS